MKKFVKWYFKVWATFNIFYIGLAILVGFMIRKGWIRGKVKDSLEFWNDSTKLGFSIYKGVFKEVIDTVRGR